MKTLAAAVLLLGGTLAGGPLLGLEWLGGALVLPAVLILLHEFAHAAAGMLLGGRVFEVRVGWHRPRFQLRLGRLRVTIARGLFRGGFCVAAFLTPAASRWRYAVLYGTPMVLHLAAAVTAVPFVALPLSLSAVGIEHFFVFYNVLLFLASARPFDHHVGAFRIPSDGQALLMLRSPVQAERWRRLGFVLPAIYALHDGEREEALARAREAEHLFTGDPEVGRALFTVYWALGFFAYALRFLGDYVGAIRQPAQFGERKLLALGALQGERLERWLHGVVCLHGEAWDAALQTVATGLEHETLAEGRGMWLALRSYILLLRDASPEDKDGARDAAREAFELLPWVPFVCGTFAASLIEAGVLEEGLRRLRDADSLDLAEQELAVRNAWRAIGHARLGRWRRARRCLREAQAGGLEVGPPPALIRRALTSLNGG